MIHANEEAFEEDLYLQLILSLDNLETKNGLLESVNNMCTMHSDSSMRD